MRLSDAWLGRAVMLAIVLIVVHALGDWASAAFGAAAGIASAVLVGTVLIFISRGASLVIVLALIATWLLLARWWSLMSPDDSVLARSVEFAPFAIGFAAPVLLLMAAYVELRLRAPAGPAGSRSTARIDA
jgi:hypothetical protein